MLVFSECEKMSAKFVITDNHFGHLEAKKKSSTTTFHLLGPTLTRTQKNVKFVVVVPQMTAVTNGDNQNAIKPCTFKQSF